MQRNALPLALAVLASLGLATSLAAQQGPTSDLLLPYFEVALDGPGVTTLFAVVNTDPHPVDVDITVHTNWGIPILESTVTLEGDSVRTINLHDWLVLGHTPGELLKGEELSHIKAAASGRRSSRDGLFYSSQVAPELAVGFVTIRSRGVPAPDVLIGDYFIVDPTEDFAQGEVLINIDPAAHCPGVCARHALRFLSGGGFDSGTDVIIWNGRQGEPSASAYYPDAMRLDTFTKAYDEEGTPLGGRQLGLLSVEVVKVEELGLVEPFGWLDISTEDDTFIGVRYSAENRYSAELQSFCLPKKPGDLPAIRIEKYTNGVDADTAPGPTVLAGGAVLWQYLVSNTGPVPLTDVRVVDDQGVDVDCPRDELAPGESMTCTGHGTADSRVCQYRNVGIAYGTPPGGAEVSDQDASNYRTSVPAALDLEVAVNGEDADSAPGPTIAPGTPLSWTFRVTNTGPSRLDDVAVEDDGGLGISCPKTSLAAGESMVCTAASTAAGGDHHHLSVAVGRALCGSSARDEDPTHYTSPSRAAVRIEKATNGHDADQAPGPEILAGDPVTWSYLVTNTGEVRLTGVRVSDSKGVAVSCPKTTLEPGASMTCSGHGTASEGQYENVGTVTTDQNVRDDDPSHYYGLSAPSCTMGIDPTSIESGGSATLTWSSSNATAASIDQGLGAVPVNGSQVVSPSDTTTYRGTFTGPGGTVYCSATVTVQPPPSCGCEGKVSELTLRRREGGSGRVVIKATHGSNQVTVFDGTVNTGDTFALDGPATSNPGFSGTLGTEITIYVDGHYHASIHTSCSQPVGPNLVAGDFIVVSGTSKSLDPVPLCPLPPPPPTCDEQNPTAWALTDHSVTFNDPHRGEHHTVVDFGYNLSNFKGEVQLFWKNGGSTYIKVHRSYDVACDDGQKTDRIHWESDQQAHHPGHGAKYFARFLINGSVVESIPLN